MQKKFDEILIVVTGVGYKRAQRIFHDGRTSMLIKIDGVNHKINIGAATAKLLAEKGAKVCMVARNKEKLQNLKEYICYETKCNPENVTYKDIDLLNKNSVEELELSLDKVKTIWLVHSVGLGAQSYDINGNNPYLPFTKIHTELITKEFEVPVKSLLLLLKSLESRIKLQSETRIVVVTSMSGIRPYIYGYSHASAKGGIHHAVRSLSLELSYLYRSVYVTEILPGIVDTGLYDSEEVIKSVQEIGETFGFFGDKKYTTDNFPLASPLSVAHAILLALQSEAHILSIDIVAQGQFNNIG